MKRVILMVMCACLFCAASASAAIWTPDGATLAGFDQTYSTSPGLTFVTDYGANYASYSTLWAQNGTSSGTAFITSNMLSWPVSGGSFSISVSITNNDENPWSFLLGVKEGSSQTETSWSALLPGQSSVFTISGSLNGSTYQLYVGVMGDFAPRSSGVGVDRTAEFTMSSAPVPIPGAVWLLGSGMLGALVIRRRFRK